jgi:predicted transcriptional regulator
LDDGGRGIARKRRDLMTTLKVGIASYEEMKARAIAVARGERRIKADEPKVWFTSMESFAKSCRPAIASCCDSPHLPESVHKEMAEDPQRLVWNR